MEKTSYYGTLGSSLALVGGCGSRLRSRHFQEKKNDHHTTASSRLGVRRIQLHAVNSQANEAPKTYCHSSDQEEESLVNTCRDPRWIIGPGQLGSLDLDLAKASPKDEPELDHLRISDPSPQRPAKSRLALRQIHCLRSTTARQHPCWHCLQSEQWLILEN